MDMSHTWSLPYCKYPTKKTIAWSLEQSTLAEGQNFAARRPLLELLTSEYNFAHGPAALPLPEPDGEVDLAVTGMWIHRAEIYLTECNQAPTMERRSTDLTRCLPAEILHTTLAPTTAT